MPTQTRYYVVYSSGKLEEVEKEKWDYAFNDPYVTLVSSDGDDFTIEKLTEETEHEDFHRISLVHRQP